MKNKSIFVLYEYNRIGVGGMMGNMVLDIGLVKEESLFDDIEREVMKVEIEKTNNPSYSNFFIKNISILDFN